MPGERPDCRAGFQRLGASIVLLWFVFWTFAYVLHSPSSENRLAPPAFSLTTKFALAATILLVGPWIITGFRPD